MTGPAGPQKNPKKSAYTPELGQRICELLAEGMSCLAISKLPGMKPESTIRRWAMEPEKSDPDFVTRYARARVIGAHARFDRLDEITERVLNEEFEKPENARIAIDAMKWQLSKMLPAVYGERSHIEHSGTLKVETVKDHAPEWMVDKLAAPAEEADEGETVH